MERFEAEAAARLAQMRHTHPAVAVAVAPAGVWDDAQRQLAGMLGGLAELTGAVPVLGDPLGGSPNPVKEGRGEGCRALGPQPSRPRQGLP